MSSLKPNAMNPSAPLQGKKLYSPQVLAVFMALANLPFGLVLYGRNLSARGEPRLGLSMAFFGVAAFLFALMLADRDALPSFYSLLGTQAAINVYCLEREPFELAIQDGASRAPWWPAALALLALTAALLVAATVG